jgi:CheY-like chemotaxis protein
MAVPGLKAPTSPTLIPFLPVLMDIDMPKKNGFEASSDIRVYEAKLKLPKAPIVAVTAIKDDAAIARGKNE